MTGRPAPHDEGRAVRGFDWEIRRELRPGYFRTYAHGYWRDPFLVCVLGRVLIGKRALRKRWEGALPGDREQQA